MRALVKAALRGRASHDALRVGEVRVASAGDRSIAITRLAGARRAFVAVNPGDAPAELALGSAGGADGLQQLDLPGISGGRMTDGGGSIVLPAMGGAVLVDS